MSGFLQDLRYASRMLVKNPWMSATSSGALALGIAVTAVMFSIVYGALMRGLPFEGGDRIMLLQRTLRGDMMSSSIHDYLDWREQQTSFESLAAYFEGTVNVRWTDRPERFDGAFITANGFAALGVQPMLGRLFREDEDEAGAPMALMLSHHVWMDRFDGSREALGRMVKVNGEQAEIVGVMPEGFLFPSRQDLWVPLRMNTLELPRGQGQGLTVYGKLLEDVSEDQAMTELSGIAARLARAYPDTNEGVGVTVGSFQKQAVGDGAPALLYTMLGVVSLVLLIACANVANLLLARAAVRTKEVGIRTAMGASRWRVLSQMVSEALALALVGAVAGSALAWLGIEWFNRAIEGTDPPFFLVFQLDLPILLFILGASILAAVVAGGIPALKSSGLDVSSVLKDESRGSSSLRIGRLTKILVVGEIAMSMALLVAAGLMTKSITTLRDYDFGFDSNEVFTARVGLFETEFPDASSRQIFYNDVRRRVADAPGVQESSLATILPGVGSNFSTIGVEGEAYVDDRDYPGARWGQVDPGYFRTLGVDVTLGRDFEASDAADAEPVAIVNASFAQRFLGGGSPLGRRFRPGRAEDDLPWLTVVGLVPDLWMQGAGNLDGDPEGYYVPVAQSDARFMSILARGPADPMELTAAVRDAVTAANADTPIYFVETLADRIAENTWVYNVFGVLFMIFGAVALVLASIGLYGVMAFSVGRRTPEVGIRMALGAQRSQVRSLILKQGAIQTLIGVGIGFGLAVLVARTLGLVLFEVSPNDPSVFGTVALVLVGTGVAASLIPARRATRVDPVVALRSE